MDGHPRQTINTEDATFMDAALALARAPERRTWPNPPVGAVVVRDGEIVGRGAHHGPGTPHAERVALEEAGDGARGATLYVTLEPCNHSGRTGPCAPAVAEAGIRRVVAGVRDPNPDVTGGGLAHLRAVGLETALGVRGAACLDLVRPFVQTDNFRRPYLILKTAASRDGLASPAVSAAEPIYLTGDAALDDVHRLRRWCDLVLVGRGTVDADRPCLDGRRAAGRDDVPATDPLPGCVSTAPAAVAGWRDDRHLVFTGEAAVGSAAPGAELVRCRLRDGRVDPADLLDRALAAGCHVIMLEGGPRLAASFLRAGLVDRWIRYCSPLELGDGVSWREAGVPEPADCGLIAAGETRLGEDLREDWDRRDWADLRAAAEGRA